MVKIIVWFIVNIIICALVLLVVAVLPLRRETETVKARIAKMDWDEALVEYKEYRRVVKISDQFHYSYSSGDVIECLLVKKYTLFGSYKGYNFILEG